MTDPREPIYIKKNGRYKAIGSWTEGWYKYDPWNSEGLWLHTRDDCSKRQFMIATLEQLPCSAASFAAVMLHQEELTKEIMKLRNKGLSANDFAAELLNWVASQTKEKTT